ncbi:MAG: NADH-quinone oxidoreductase subunit J [Planctomycetota bacterium]|nr:NADH-quinone oxidoreductase subunit J [Planctomycetota bacterium]
MINWNSFFFLLFALVACFFALAVVFTGSVVRMAFFLVLCLSATAGLFFLANADFVGAMQLLIYVGGTMVLLVFGVMLTAQGPFVRMKTDGGQWLVALIVGSSLLAVLITAAFRVESWRRGPVGEAATASTNLDPTATPIGMALLGVRVDAVDEPDAVLRSGLSGYLLPFEIVSVHLLVVLIGAAYLARTKKRVRDRTV